MAFNLFEAPEYYQGLLGEDATNKLQNKALTTGLINAAIGYLAQPKTGGYGSALPYLGRALAGGLQAGQETIRSGLTDFENQQKIAEMRRKQEMQKAQDLFRSRIGQPNAERQIVSQSTVQEPVMPMADATAPSFRTQLPQPTVTTQKYFDPNVMMNEALQSGALPFEKYLELTAKQKTDSPIGKLEPQNFTPESWAEFVNSGYDTTKLRAAAKPSKDTAFIQNYEYAVSKGYQGSPADWQKLNIEAAAQYQAPYKTAEQERQEIETAYKYGAPPSAVPAPKSATMKDVADTAKATGKTTSQVIQDLKSRGIKVQGAK